MIKVVASYFMHVSARMINTSRYMMKKARSLKIAEGFLSKPTQNISGKIYFSGRLIRFINLFNLIIKILFLYLIYFYDHINKFLKNASKSSIINQ